MPQFAGKSLAVAMRPANIRFSDGLWRLIRSEAEREGISASQYVRESVILRAAWDEAQRTEPGQWDRAIEVVRRLITDEE